MLLFLGILSRLYLENSPQSMHGTVQLTMSGYCSVFFLMYAMLHYMVCIH